MDKVASKLTKVVSRKTAINANKLITIEADNLAKFADGACTCSMGDTSVLVTAVSESPKKPNSQSFVPLSVEYKQKAAAAGRIPMTHMRRDIGITEREILVGRMIDKSIRPAFLKGYNYDTQIICNLLAVDGVHDADILAINGASASLSISDIPWNGPIGAVRMGLSNENVVVNPTRHELENSRLNLVMAANNEGNLLMIDGSCKEPVLMPDIQKAIKQGVKECQNIIESISKLKASIGREKRVFDFSKLIASPDHLNFALTFAQEKGQESFNEP